jgi:hypothetical protein
MDTQTKSTSNTLFSTCEDVYYSEYKNFIIIVLLTLLILAVLGINVCWFVGDMVGFLLNPIIQVVRNILNVFVYGIGHAINDVADAAADGAKAGIEIADGTVHDATNILIDATDVPSDEEIARERAIEKHKREKCEGFSLHSQSFDEKINKSSVAETPQPSPFIKIQPLIANNASGDDWCSVNAMDSIEGSRNCKSFLFLHQ